MKWHKFNPWNWERCVFEARPPNGLCTLHVMSRVLPPRHVMEILIEPDGRGMYYCFQKHQFPEWEDMEALLKELTQVQTFEQLMALIRRKQNELEK